MHTHDFDVAVTFAGEDRSFVQDVVTRIKSGGLSVFFDEDSKVEMWGEDLTEYFANVYERRARYAVMFISAHYAQKAWTQLERRSVLARALESNAAYLLPVRLDSTELPGVRSTVAYLEASREGAEGIADAIRAKVGGHGTNLSPKFNGRTPRTAAEAAILLGERPAGWEYLLFSYYLTAGIESSRDRYNDHRIGFASGGDFIPSEEIRGYLQSELARMSATADSFESLLRGPAQEAAMGLPGEEGDPELIQHLASRLVAIYAELLSWAYRLRAASSPIPAGREAMRALSDYANQPTEAIRAFVVDFQLRMDALSPQLQSGQDVHLTLGINFEIPKEISRAYHRAERKLPKQL